MPGFLTPFIAAKPKSEIGREMDAFHAQEACETDYERIIPKKLKMGMGMAYESWHPSWTMGIPTALCLN